MALREYRKKRNFKRTPEPAGGHATRRSHHYVIQKHDATRLHYDFRLELDGVLLSWAVPKGPSLDPAEKRLAVQVEDHPLDYRAFEGTIPEGEYGGGTVMVWDQGYWTPDEDAHRGMQEGKLKFSLHGKKLQGRWFLLRMKGDRWGQRRTGGKTKPNWLLIKERDEYVQPASKGDVLEKLPNSAKTGRTMEEIAAGRKVWHTNRPAANKKTAAAKGRTAKMIGSVKKNEKNSLTTVRGIGRHRIAQQSANGKWNKELAKAPNVRRAPFPKQIHPQLATLVKDAPDVDGWIHEQKFDGYRMICFVRDGRVRFVSRNNQDWTSKMQSLAPYAAALPAQQTVLDGEVVVLDANGVSNFQALQNAFREERTNQLVYFAFDLMHLDGFDLSGLPLERRKAILQSLLKKQGSRKSHIRLSEHLTGPGSALRKKMCELGLEGIISKRCDGPYLPGRTLDWLKSKCRQEQEFVIGGFTQPSGASSGFWIAVVGLLPITR